MGNTTMLSEHTVSSNDISRLRVLIVDDNNFMRRLLRTMVFGYGIREVFDAENGAAGFELFCTVRPDIVITDWEMPTMDGLGMTRFMRQHAWSRDPFVPILMTTVNTERRRIIEACQAGVSDIMARPISSALLLRRMMSAITSPPRFIRTASYFGPDRRRQEPGLDLDASGPGLEVIHPQSVLDRLHKPIEDSNRPLTSAGEIIKLKPVFKEDFESIETNLDAIDAGRAVCAAH
jgi:two-component system, chemotaxis family, chemotaxis protein CheY